MWEYDAQHDSLITAGNGTAKPHNAALTIFYNEGRDKYEVEKTLQPDEQLWLDLGQVIRGNVPDKNGHTLPPDLTMGSYEIRDLTDPGVGGLFEGKVVNDHTYGSATYGCANCCGFIISSLGLDFNPLGCGVGALGINGVEADDNCGDEDVNIDTDFEGGWTTAKTTIATVNCCGTHTGVASGTTTTKALWFRIF